MEKIKPKKVLFIKLGEKGKYAKDCIENSIIRLSYSTVDHTLCMNKKWEEVKSYFIHEEKCTSIVASSHTNQIKQFYEEDETTLWVTFYLNKLWWCFSKKEIEIYDDKTKTRPVIGKWSDRDVSGNTLFTSNLMEQYIKHSFFVGRFANWKQKKS